MEDLKGAKVFYYVLFVRTGALLMAKNNQFLSGKVMEATPASPSTCNPELNSYVAFSICKNRSLRTCQMLADICSSSIHRSTLLCVQCNNQNTSLVASTDKEQKRNKTCKVTVCKSCEVSPVPCAGKEQVKCSRRHSFFHGPGSSAAAYRYYLGELSVFGEFTVA